MAGPACRTRTEQRSPTKRRDEIDGQSRIRVKKREGFDADC